MANRLRSGSREAVCAIPNLKQEGSVPAEPGSDKGSTPLCLRLESVAGQAREWRDALRAFTDMASDYRS